MSSEVENLVEAFKKLSEWHHQGRDMGHVQMYPFTKCPHHACRQATEALAAYDPQAQPEESRGK